jgi:hypothetical protein
MRNKRRKKSKKGKKTNQGKETSRNIQDKLRAALKIVQQRAVEEIKDVGQALEWGRGRPRKKEECAGEDRQRSNSPGSGKRSVPNMGAGHCLGPEGNGVSLGEGG